MGYWINKKFRSKNERNNFVKKLNVNFQRKKSSIRNILRQVFKKRARF